MRSLRYGFLALALAMSGAAAQSDFPFDQELILEADPLPGSEQRPILNVGADGAAEIDLWCRSGTGRIIVAGETITIAVGVLPERSCTPERMQADAELLAELAEVRTWRREEDTLVLIGAKILHFRLSTH